MANFKIIDISNHNGSVNWKQVKEDKIDGVMIRAGYGFWNEDTRLLDNVKGAEAYGIPYGLYFYSYATNMEQARAEVNGFLNSIKNFKPTLPVVCDTEDADYWRQRNGNPSWRLLADMCYMQLKELEKAGYYAMWYANLYWARNLLAVKPELKTVDLWLAHWTNKMGNPGMPVGIWQYTSSGPAYGSGIQHTDMNIGFLDYPSIIKKAGLNGHKKSPVIPTTKNKVENVRPKKKDIETLAQEVRKGLWGDQPEREKRLTRAGYSFLKVQARVNELESIIRVGDYVRITGSRYATGETIPGWVKKQKHKVSQISGSRALLGYPSGISSWVYLKDLKKA